MENTENDTTTSEAADKGPKRDRGPSFPFIGLAKAVERTAQLYAKARRFEVRVSDAATDWGLGAKSSAVFQIVGALLAYGLIEDSGSGDARKIKVSDAGMRILDDTRPGVRERLLAEAAMKPKLIAEHAMLWKSGRPDDSHAISDLKFDRGFTDEGARKFLRVFDETIRFTNPQPSDTVKDPEAVVTPIVEVPPSDKTIDDGGKIREKPPLRKKDVIVMDGERELTTGLLSKGASFRLIVSGPIGQKEIERLIKKLELDKEILADADEEEDKGVFG